MMEERVPAKLCDSKSMDCAFKLLRSYPLIGDFLAYQFVIDLNYSNILNFSEMEFVVAGLKYERRHSEMLHWKCWRF